MPERENTKGLITLAFKAEASSQDGEHKDVWHCLLRYLVTIMMQTKRLGCTTQTLSVRRVTCARLWSHYVIYGLHLPVAIMDRGSLVDFLYIVPFPFSFLSHLLDSFS